MTITSPSFKDAETIPRKFTCEGGDINPELNTDNVPGEARSLALIVDDPDAPSGLFTHWLVWNIDAKTKIIKEESVPPGSVEGLNSAGQNGYIGPCPPSGTHRYRFKLFALDTVLDLDPASNADDFMKIAEGHIIDQAIITGIYARDRQ